MKLVLLSQYACCYRSVITVRIVRNISEFLILMQKIRAIGPTVGAGEAVKDRKTNTHIRKQ